ncbi:hypothetical protein [Mesorhizobium sp.]|nr:hypothetical protein [Mesorhizobium sp.]
MIGLSVALNVAMFEASVAGAINPPPAATGLVELNGDANVLTRPVSVVQ